MTDPVTLDGEGFIGEFDEKRAENAVRELLIAVGEDPEREGLRDTPARVARAYRELLFTTKGAAEPTVAVMVLRVGREDLASAHAEVGRAV